MLFKLLSSIMPKKHGCASNLVLGLRSIRSKLSTDERQVQRTSNQIERENYEHEHYEKTGRQGGTGHRRFTQHWCSDRQTTRDRWRGSRPYVTARPMKSCARLKRRVERRWRSRPTLPTPKPSGWPRKLSGLA